MKKLLVLPILVLLTGRFECVTGELPYDGQTHPAGNFFYIEDGYLDFTNDDC